MRISNGAPLVRIEPNDASASPSRQTIAGLIVCAIVAALATYLAVFAPLLGAPVIAILFGVVLRSFVATPASLVPCIGYSAKAVLQAAIVVSRFAISLSAIRRTGIGTLPVTLGTIAFALGLAPFSAHVSVTRTCDGLNASLVRRMGRNGD